MSGPPLDAGRVRALLCDADGNLFASEEPAFVASADVTNRLLASVGVGRRFTPTELRLATTGQNFRTTATQLVAELGDPAWLDPDELERWVAEERRTVTAHLGGVLEPDAEVTRALEELAGAYTLAAVSSSARSRLDVCFEAAALSELFPATMRFSAEDSLPSPRSKPDPAIYSFTLERLGLEPTEALAIEDAPPGVRSAVAAGIPTAGNLAFVPHDERAHRRAELESAGAAAVVESWSELADMLRRDAATVDTLTN